MQASQTGVLFGVALAALNEATAEAGEQSAPLLAMVHGEDGIDSDAVGPELGIHTLLGPHAVGPGPFPGADNQPEARIEVGRGPLVVGHVTAVRTQRSCRSRLMDCSRGNGDVLAGQGLEMREPGLSGSISTLLFGRLPKLRHCPGAQLAG